jgi:hypothetical protein
MKTCGHMNGLAVIVEHTPRQRRKAYQRIDNTPYPIRAFTRPAPLLCMRNLDARRVPASVGNFVRLHSCVSRHKAANSRDCTETCKSPFPPQQRFPCLKQHTDGRRVSFVFAGAGIWAALHAAPQPTLPAGFRIPGVVESCFLLWA